MRSGLDTWTGPDGATVRYVDVWSLGRVRMAAGGPIGGDGPLAVSMRAFEAEARRGGARVCWFGVTDQELAATTSPRIVIGAEPVWRVQRWAEIVASKRSVRAQIARARNKGVSISAWSQARVRESPVLRAILDDWLDRRGLPPLSFLADPFVLDAPGDRQFWAATHSGRVVGYLVLVPGDEALVEWIIQRRDAPNGTAALLLDTAIRALPETSTFTLGLVPLSTFAPLTDPAPSFVVRALLSWVRAHATRFYNFDGLERFKAKFVPDHWRPLWLVTDGRPITVATFHAVAAAFSGDRGPTRFVARALVDASLEEARRLRDAIRQRVSWRQSGTSPRSSD